MTRSIVLIRSVLALMVFTVGMALGTRSARADDGSCAVPNSCGFSAECSTWCQAFLCNSQTCNNPISQFCYKCQS